ncbi:hypothetical protein B296_00018625 [Ensete ventricosum]|uniref:RRM domain-containing protein n=1 Tax=Ensete ventricosum TaxID=4639 RepID=A0A426YUP5_ENSVE|nr:hypothetical protein B296_00018625 [Ensete ventricosum]
MATVVSFRSLDSVPTLSSHSPAHRDRTGPSHHCLLPRSPGPRPLRLKTLGLLPLLSLPLSPSRLHNSTSVFASAAAAYSGDEDEEEEQFEDEQQDDDEEEQAWNRSKASSRAIFPPQEVARLYVGNLPFTTTPAQLAEVFSEAGTVETVEVRVALTLLFTLLSHQVVYDRVTERSRGFAFVTMASVEEANEAICMFDGSQLSGRTVKVNVPEVPRGGEREVLGPRMRNRGFVDSPYKVYAGNLGWSLTSEALRDTFFSQPGLLGAKVIFDRDTGRSKGYGFVSFASAEECQAAVEAMNGVVLVPYSFGFLFVSYCFT